MKTMSACLQSTRRDSRQHNMRGEYHVSVLVLGPVTPQRFRETQHSSVLLNFHSNPPVKALEPAPKVDAEDAM